MGLGIKSIIATSFFIISHAVYAQMACSSPIKIEIYDESSRLAARLIKKNINEKSNASIKIENIVKDQYGFTRRPLPYVYGDVTIFSRKGIDETCVASTVKALKQLGFKKNEIAFRSMRSGIKFDSIRISIPPRTHVYEYDGTFSINP